MQVATSTQALEKLSSMRHQAAADQQLCDEAACTVCQQDYAAEDEIVSLPCKHWFHRSCVFQWLQTSKQCPMCMREVEA
jgi:E3 ubiquitin-protein ligase DOA10